MQNKIDRDFCLNFDWLAVQVVRPVLPFTDSRQRCGHQERLPAFDLGMLDRPIAADERPDYDRSLNPHLLRDRGIPGLDFVHQIAFHDDRHGGGMLRRCDGMYDRRSNNSGNHIVQSVFNPDDRYSRRHYRGRI